MSRFGVIIFILIISHQAKSTEVYICNYFESEEEVKYECKLISEIENPKTETPTITTINPDDYSFLDL